MTTANGIDSAWQDAHRATLTVVVVDLVESVRIIGTYGDDAIERWRRFILEARERVVPAHGGRVVRSMGDGMLLAFDSSRRATQAAFVLHRTLALHNEGRAAAASLALRVGLHLGEVLVDGIDLYGHVVNLTARICGRAQPGNTVVSAEVRDHLVDGVDAEIEDLGEVFLKGIDDPVRLYTIHPPGGLATAIVVPAPPDDLRPALAVLPITTHADTTVGAVAGEVLADELIIRLSRGAQIRLTSRLSTSALAGRDLAPAQIGELLGVAYVVSGKLRIVGSNVVAVCELADTQSGNIVWADSVRADLRDLLRSDGEIVNVIATAVCDAIVRHQLRKARHTPLPSLAGYSLLMAGISLMHRFSADDFARARDCLGALIERAPRHATPYAWLARWHVFKAVQGWTDDGDRERRQALDLTRRALELDPESPIALTIAGSVKVGLERDLDGAQQLYRDALRVDPSEPLAWLLLGTAHTFKGEGREAISHAECAVSLSPLDPMRFFYQTHAAAAALAADQYERAVQLAAASLRGNRLHHSTLRTLAIAQAMAGQDAAARETVSALLAEDPSLTVHSFLARSPGGRFEHARRYGEALGRVGLPSGKPLH